MGTISNVKDAVNWLAYTYLYVWMLRSYKSYGISHDEIANDPYLVQWRIDLIHSAAILLEQANLIQYEWKSG